MTVWSWIRLRIYLWLLVKALKVAGWVLLVVAAVVLWPVTSVAGLAFAVAWLRGWPPVRLARTALWALPMTFISTVDRALHVHSWRALVLAPVHTWAASFHHLGGFHLVRTAVLLGPVAIPVGLALGSLLWWWRIFAISSGHAGWLASAPFTFDAQLWGRQVRTARGRTAAQGLVPLLARHGRIPVGGTIRSVGHGWHPIFSVPATACNRHQVFIGATGSGKTNLMMRLWAGWFRATLESSGTTGRRPALIVLDCKGGLDARQKAERTKRLLYGAGARRVAIWPEQASLSLWDLPPGDLAVLLFQMIESGDGAAAYYADIMQAVLMLATTAPVGPPLSAAGFLDRLNVRWLRVAWDDGRHPSEVDWIRAATKHMPDIQLRFVTLLQRLGPGLDGPGNLADADVWYFILEGTREPSVAEAQAMAITELTAAAAVGIGGTTEGPTSANTEPKLMLLAADDYSAVSGRVPLSNLYERGRSLGIGMQVSAQSWQGLGADEDERYRIAATADGGIWVLETPYPEPLSGLAGQRRVLDTARRMAGVAWGPDGTTQERRAWVADPELIRRLEVGQACYIHHGAATFVQVARPKPSPLTLMYQPLPAEPVVPPPRRDPVREPGPEPPPVPVQLEDVLGPGGPW